MRVIFRYFFDTLIRVGTSILCKIDKSDFCKVPRKGPLIIVTNHIGSLEVPLLFVHLQPRKLTGLAKVETWDNKFMGWLFDLWGAIPVRRGDADMDAIHKSIQVLKAGGILGVAPEGTRSRDGKLLQAQPGVVLLAQRTGAPILPLAHWGGEQFSHNLRKFKRTEFHVRVGRPFILDTRGEKVTGEIRQKIADEIMGQVAALMPDQYHGEYRGRTASMHYLRWAGN